MNLERSVEINCPYCGEIVELLVDCSAGPQVYVEDCHVCCRPMEVRAAIGSDGTPTLEVRREDD